MTYDGGGIGSVLPEDDLSLPVLIPGLPIKEPDLFHFISRQFKAEYVVILRDVVRIA